MATTKAFTDANGMVRFGPIPVNLITDTDVVLGIPIYETTQLIAQDITVQALSVLGTLSVAGTAIVDDGTTGHNVSSSTTFTSLGNDKFTKLTIPANAYVVQGDPDTTYFRLHITANASGQATTFRARTDGVATLTTAVAHGLSVGDEINVLTVGGTGYNGRVVVLSVPSATTFTYASPGTDEASAADTAGRVGAADVQVFIWAQQLSDSTGI
jgi:hypothetical protein